MSVRQLRSGDLWQVAAIERQAFPEDSWTLATGKGFLARATLGRQARYAAWLDWSIRVTRLNQVINLARLTHLVTLRRPASLHYVVATSGRAVIGYACVNARTGGDGDIQSIAVRADQRGQGLGRRLLAHVVALAAACGSRGVVLYVRADNDRARLLYQRTGFTETDLRRGYYQPSGTDAIVMRMAFPAPRDCLPQSQDRVPQR